MTRLGGQKGEPPSAATRHRPFPPPTTQRGDPATRTPLALPGPAAAAAPRAALRSRCRLGLLRLPLTPSRSGPAPPRPLRWRLRDGGRGQRGGDERRGRDGAGSAAAPGAGSPSRDSAAPSDPGWIRTQPPRSGTEGPAERGPQPRLETVSGWNPRSRRYLGGL